MSSSTDILWIDDLTDEAIPVAGSKIARLGELRRCGCKVPEGFVITTSVFHRFMHSHGLQEIAAEALEEIEDPDDGEAVERAARRARGAIEAARMPRELAHEVIDSYEELCFRLRDLNAPTAVRSSATGEDSADASFAGQFDTYLGVTGHDRLIDSIKACWGSLFTARAIRYRLKHGLSHDDCPMAVGVIHLVHAIASGVAFSIHPVTGNRTRMVIEGNWGWGEAVVQGVVTPDHIEIGKSDRRILDYRVSDKVVVSAFDYAQSRVVERPMPNRLRNEPILTDEQVQAVVDTVLSVEDHYGYPVDVEWVLSRHRREGEPMTVVQARPVTVHADKPAVPTWDPVKYAAKYAFGGKGTSGS